MKQLILLILLVQYSLNAQNDWKINSLEISMGRTPLTSGLTFSSSFSKVDQNVLVNYNNDLGEMVYLLKLNNNIQVGPSGGFLKNVPYIGSLAIFKIKNIQFLTWIGGSFGDPEKQKTELRPFFLFCFNQVTFSLTWAEFSYSLLHYQRLKPEHIFNTKFIYDLNKKTFIFISSGFMTREEIFIWATGLKYKL